MTSVVAQITFYGNWVISILGFIYWAYQIVTSAHQYYNHDKYGNATKEILLLHFLLFVANILYLFYEVNYTWTPIYFTMLLLTDITGIWCYNLIMAND